jgi:hypothetical protein
MLVMTFADYQVSEYRAFLAWMWVLGKDQAPRASSACWHPVDFHPRQCAFWTPLNHVEWESRQL